MLDEILKAAARLNGITHKTPVTQSSTLNNMTGGHVFFKCENLQRVGAFKIRGAYNAISKLSPEEKAKGVLTYSSGNHAQGVALAGKLLGVKTVVVMPENAPKIKIAATRGYGAEIVLHDPDEAKREQVAAELQAKHAYTLIPPYDHKDIVAGQGTAALELLQETGELDYLIAPCGGGGLLSGSAVAAKGLFPHIKVIGIEPEVANDGVLSFKTGVLHTVSNPPTIADGVRTPSLGKITFSLIRQYVDDMLTVSEEEIKEAVRFFFYRMKLVVEPSGALGLACLLAGKLNFEGKKVGVIISGGNVDGEMYAGILQNK